MIFSTIIRGVTTIVQFVEHSGFARKRRPLVATIQRMSAEHFGFHPDLMKAAGRTREIAQSRQIAMYLARELTTHSLPQIGRFFGNRDHTTVLHAIRVVEQRICSSVEVAEHVEAIREMLAA